MALDEIRAQLAVYQQRREEIRIRREFEQLRAADAAGYPEAPVSAPAEPLRAATERAQTLEEQRRTIAVKEESCRAVAPPPKYRCKDTEEHTAYRRGCEHMFPT